MSMTGLCRSIAHEYVHRPATCTSLDKPPITRSVPARPTCLDELRSEPLHSPADRHVIDLHATLDQQLRDVTV